jgi:hypothetical protein
MVLINNWSLINLSTSPYIAPEQRSGALSGNVYGHKSFKDGEHVITGVIIEAKDNIVKTKNTTYQLGFPSKNYQSWYEKKYKKKLSDFPFSNK